MTLMKIKLAIVAAIGAFLFCGVICGQQPTIEKAMVQPGASLPSKLGAPANLKKYNVTIRRFDPKKGLENGEDFVLPVDSPDEEHAISSTLANAVAFTKKSQGVELLSVAFCCTGIQERK